MIPLRRPQGGGGVQPDPAHLLSEQHHRHPGAVREMARAGVFRLVFSSSATVYGDPASVPLRGKTSHRRHQPLWPLQADGGRDTGDLSKSDPRWAHRPAALLQPGRCPRAASSGKIPAAFPTTCCPISARLGWASSRSWGYSATTTRRRMAPGCATTSTSWISPSVTSRRWPASRATPGLHL